MRSESVFGLEKAGWPSLVFNETGMIHEANAAAVRTFGLPHKPARTPLSSIWASENQSSIQDFFGRLKDLAGEDISMNLRTAGGQVVSYRASLAICGQEKGTLYLLQLFARTASPGIRKAEPGAVSIEPGSLPPPSRPEGGSSENGQGQRQKLECALQLARTVALDFNNALTSILGHTSLILGKMEHNHPWRNSLLEIEKSAEKAAEVASDLAAFSRQDKDVRSQVAGNLNDVVRRTVELFQTQASTPANWTLELEPKLYTVTFEEAKLQQAFVKILDNAVQAIRQGGRIVVRTRNQDNVNSLQDGAIRLPEGHYVCVEFRDEGCGIPRDILPRIFDPFFTTKQSPHHRGLGLAWVYGIVTNHGGSVAVSSEVGRGTAVRVYLPAQKKIVRDHSVQTDNLSGTETILMVDDEELLLTMGEMVLSSFGYRVLTAPSGQRALEIFAESSSEIDLVITDMVMPKMSGRELMERLRRLDPELKIICSSGYSRAMPKDEEEMYLQKPFTSLDLLRKVKQALALPVGS